MGGIVVIYLAIIVLMIAAMWVVFAKAGQPGWAAIVPFYNMWVLLQIAGKPPVWFILFLIPFVNIVFLFLTYIAVAERFGKTAGFGVGMVFLPFVFWPMLAWGDAAYTPPNPALA